MVTLLVMLFAFNVVLAICAWSITNNPQTTLLEDMIIQAEQVPLAATKVSGVLTPALEDVVAQNDVELDCSYLDKGYIYIRYIGEKTRMQFLLTGPGHEDPAVYSCPVNGVWAGYPLPYGAGEYKIITHPYDTGEERIPQYEAGKFVFTATHTDETEPFRYNNAFSDYNETSLTSRLAQVVLEQREEEEAHLLSSAEKVDAIVGFVYEQISGDSTVADTRASEGIDHFQDNMATLSAAKGSCADKAGLAASMLKAQGFPVRIHYGNIVHGGEPSYHAWINVWVDEQWVMYDPSFYSNAVTDNGLSVGNEYIDTTTLQ